MLGSPGTTPPPLSSHALSSHALSSQAPTIIGAQAPVIPQSPQARTLIADLQSPGSTAPAMPPPAPIPIAPMPVRAMPTVLDVTPRGLGIATVAGFCEELIQRNARLPTEMKKIFATSRDQQDQVVIVVCQGESRRLDSNVVIGDLKLENLPPRPRGETKIEETFSLDASGILNVRARDEKTGKEQRARLDTVGNLSDAQVGASRERIAQLDIKS